MFSVITPKCLIISQNPQKILHLNGGMADSTEPENEAQQARHGSFDSGISSQSPDAEVHGEDETTRLRALAADVRDQDDLERDVGRQARATSLRLTLSKLIHNHRQIRCLQSKPMKEIRSV